jgi:N-acetylneuraminate synthase
VTAPHVTIGRRRVGPGYPLYFIAEAGSNHDKKLDQAHRLIDVAADAGADAVKFQTFKADKLYPRNAGITKYLQVPKSIHEIIRELEMPFEWIPELAAHCKERDIDFLSTPFDEESADALDPYVSAFKVDDLVLVEDDETGRSWYEYTRRPVSTPQWIIDNRDR